MGQKSLLLISPVATILFREHLVMPQRNEIIIKNGQRNILSRTIKCFCNNIISFKVSCSIVNMCALINGSDNRLNSYIQRLQGYILKIEAELIDNTALRFYYL